MADQESHSYPARHRMYLNQNITCLNACTAELKKEINTFVSGNELRKYFFCFLINVAIISCVGFLTEALFQILQDYKNYLNDIQNKIKQFTIGR